MTTWPTPPDDPDVTAIEQLERDIATLEAELARLRGVTPPPRTKLDVLAAAEQRATPMSAIVRLPRWFVWASCVAWFMAGLWWGFILWGPWR